MPTFAINLSAVDAARLRIVAARDSTPEVVLLAQVKTWLEAQAPDVLEPGLSPAPPGMFPDDGSQHYFFDPRDADPSRAEDFLTPEQRLDAVAEILATIALRVIKKKEQGQEKAASDNVLLYEAASAEEGDGSSCSVQNIQQEEVPKKLKRREQYPG